MKVLYKWKGSSALLASVVLLGTTATTLAEASSTIRFSGAIVAPTFGITASSVEPATPATHARGSNIAPDGTVAITFSACPDCAVGADVSIAAVDRSGPGPAATNVRRVADGNPRYHIGSAGGVVRFQPPRVSAPQAPERLYTVVTSYL